MSTTTPAIQMALDFAAETGSAMRRAAFDAQWANNELHNVVAEELDLKDVCLDFFWGCRTSPTGGCVYDLAVDPWHDDCIFCHEPQERK